MTKFKIVIPCYNCEQWIGKTIDSIKKQTYKDWECLIIDDMSTDNTTNIIHTEIKDSTQFSFILNSEKKYALKNLYEGFKYLSGDDEDVFITVDGDDWLYDEKVLEKLNKVYTTEDCLMTYGSFIEYPSGITHAYYLSPYDNYIINNNLFRNVPWKASHLRTFKRKLWNNIRKEDLINLDTLEFYEVAWDLAFMYPMLEMSGPRSRHIADYMYVYNKENPLSDMYIKQQQQLNAATQIINRPKYSQKEF